MIKNERVFSRINAPKIYLKGSWNLDNSNELCVIVRV